MGAFAPPTTSAPPREPAQGLSNHLLFINVEDLDEVMKTLGNLVALNVFEQSDEVAKSALLFFSAFS